MFFERDNSHAYPASKEIKEKRMSLGKILTLPVLAAALLSATLVAPAKAPAQISIGVNFGAEPVCPYGYFDYAPYNCAPYGTMGLTGSTAVSLSAQATGSMGRSTSTATSTTATIPSMATKGRCPGAARNPSTTSRAMRRATERATWVLLRMNQPTNTHFPVIEAAEAAAEDANRS